MKNFSINIILILIINISSFAQSVPEGMKYQAVARSPSGEIIADQPISLNIKLKGNSNTGNIYYSEEHFVTTNQFGLFVLIIGEGTPHSGDFEKIPWSNNDIWMEIAVKSNKQTSFSIISNSKLLSVPYAFHAGTATSLSKLNNHNKKPIGVPSNVWSTMGNSKTDPTVDKIGTTDAKDFVFISEDLERMRILQGGNIEIKYSLDVVENLSTGGNVYLNYTGGVLNGNDNIPWGSTYNFGDFTVGTLENSSSTNLYGQTTINWLEVGTEDLFQTYPLKILGNKTGIGIKMENDEPGPADNFITFFNKQNVPIGRIEGNANVVSDAISIIEAILRDDDSVILTDGSSYNLNNENDKEFLKETYFKNDTAIEFATVYSEALFHAFMTGVNLGIAIPTVGAGADFDDVIDQLKKCLKALFKAEKIILTADQQGVSYSSGGADYAEWLRKANQNEKISYGEVVGVKGGLISKTFTDADQFMAITSNPIIIGAMPQKEIEKSFEKVALMGQVPILVEGTVEIGDYILPSGEGNGVAKAVNPINMQANDFSKIIGVAWSDSENSKYFNYINTAVGFNGNQMGMVVNNMQVIIDKIQNELVKLNPSFEPIYISAQTIEIQQPNLTPVETATCDCTETDLSARCKLVCRFNDYLEDGDLSKIDAQNNLIIDLLEKLKEETVDSVIDDLIGSLNDIFPDIQNSSQLDKIPEIKDVVLDIMDGPPFTKPDIGKIIEKLKTRVVRIDYFLGV